MNIPKNLNLLSPFNLNLFRRSARRCLAKGYLLAAAGLAMGAASARAQIFDTLEVGAGEILIAGEIVLGLQPLGSFENPPPPPVPLGPPSLIIETNTLTIAPTGTLDLGSYAIIVRETPYASILPYVATGYNGGLWDGFGMNSRTAAEDSLHLTAIGIIDNAEAQYPEFFGRSLVPAAEVIARFTYYGDANLDGDVNAADLALFGTGSGWYHGDFDYDGAVTATDLALFNASFAYVHPGEQIPQVPEPGTLSLLAAAAASMTSRRRKEG